MLMVVAAIFLLVAIVGINCGIIQDQLSTIIRKMDR